MTTNKHTPEPWRIELVNHALGDTGDYEGVVEIRAGETKRPMIEIWDDSDEAEANARRIVACVNACAGIPTETIEAVATDRQFFPLDLKCSSRKGLITLLGIQNFTVQGLKKQADSETRKKLKNQRDELLAALTKLSGMKLNIIADGIVDKAIAIVKGGAA